jgi:glutathione S-transferase
MKQDKPRLVTFACSPFCEKARWALDWHGIEYEEIGWPVGLHEMLAKRCGAPATTVPILLDGDNVIQGSGAIIDWADQKDQDPSRKLTLSGSPKIEQRADDVIGLHVRRLYFSEMLPTFPGLIKPGFFQNMSASHRLIGNMMWPVAWRVMIRRYDASAEAASESRSKLDAELEWLESTLNDRSYLIGDNFSRADLTVSSLLAPIACPQELPAYRTIQFSDALVADVKRWQRHPVMRWVAEQYEAHRAPMHLAA